MLERVLGFDQHDAASEKLARLEHVLARYDLGAPDTVRLFASLLSLPVPESATVPAASPERQRRLLLEMVPRLLLAMAAQQPLLCVFEDLHWIDASTLELLDLLVAQVPS